MINESSAAYFLDSAKTLEDLDETDKVKLRKLLLALEFGRILSTDNVKIDLDNENINSNNDSGSSLEQDDLINHLNKTESGFILSGKASEEIVQYIYEGNHIKSHQITLVKEL